MDSYDDLVSNVLANEILVDVTNNLVDEHCLNLVADDWLSRLENNITYQNYSTHSKDLWKPSYSTDHCDCEKSKHSNFQVVLVAACNFLKPYKKKTSKSIDRNVYLNVVNSEPLTKLARAMTSDLGSDIEISNDFKFSFGECSLIGCCKCSKFAQKFQKAGYTISRVFQPCISDTKIFDGEHVVNRFYSQMEAMYTDTFLAVLRLQINVRYYLKEKKYYRISGNILDFVGFHQNKLRSIKKVELGPLIQFEEPKALSTNDAKPKNKSLDPESKMKNDIEEFEEFVESVDVSNILENEESSENRKRKEMSPDVEEGETELETKRQNLTDTEDYELEQYLLI